VAEAVPFDRFAGLIPDGARLALSNHRWQAAVMPGGRQVNLSLHLRAPGESDVVLRVRRGPDLPGAYFPRELACHQLAARAGLAPRIRAADASQGWLLMDYVAADPWSTASLADEAALWRLGDRLRELHAIELPQFAPVNGLALLQANCDLLVSRGEARAAELLSEGAALTAQLQRLPNRPPVLCHGDPDVANFLGEAPVLIDFEYAQSADPTYDLALLLDYYPLPEGRVQTLQKAMGLDDELSRRRLPLQRELCRIVNVAWERAQRLASRTLD